MRQLRSIRSLMFSFLPLARDWEGLDLFPRFISYDLYLIILMSLLIPYTIPLSLSSSQLRPHHRHHDQQQHQHRYEKDQHVRLERKALQGKEQGRSRREPMGPNPTIYHGGSRAAAITTSNSSTWHHMAKHSFLESGNEPKISKKI